jgi:hypothetical protein
MMNHEARFDDRLRKIVRHGRGGEAGMTIFARIADWLRGSERANRPDGYIGLTGSDKFEALVMRGSYGEARKIMEQVEAERGEAQSVEHKLVEPE